MGARNRSLLVPGWVLIALMTAALAVAVWEVAKDGIFGERETNVLITARNVAFDTEEIALKVGETVTVELVNEDDVPHAFTSDPFDVDLIVERHASGTITLTPEEPGNFAFYCKLHPQIMVGTVEVEG